MNAQKLKADKERRLEIAHGQHRKAIGVLLGRQAKSLERHGNAMTRETEKYQRAIVRILRDKQSRHAR